MSRFKPIKGSSLYCIEGHVSREEIVHFARHLIARRFRRGSPLNSAQLAKDYFKLKLAEYEHEVFGVLYLDNQHRVLRFEELFQGTIDGCSVYPREVAKRALLHNAAAVILAHNHPSGFAKPSRADRAITERLKDALALIDVRLLDHFVVGGDDIVSFAEQGLL